MAESSTGMNFNNYVKSVVYQGRRLLHIHIIIIELLKG
jgi:hypothetical protein